MLVVQLAITSIIFLGLLISNVLTVVLIALFIFGDEYADIQGVDYYIVSLAISDLLLGTLMIPFSLISLSVSQWTFGPEVCAFYAYLWFSLWLINIYTFALLSTDRCLYITNRKYRQYKNRTRAGCICETLLAWFIALSFSFVPASLYNAHSSTLLVDHKCTINWYKAVGYFAAVIIATVVPCILCSIFSFTKIFYWRMQWKCQKIQRKLSGDTVESLLDSTHVLSLVLFLIFLFSWMPFCVDIYGYVSELQVPSVYSFWIGVSQGIWKFPIMIICCPRYREYFCNVGTKKCTNATANTNGRLNTIQFNTEPSSQQSLSHTAEADDIELHM